VKVKKDQTVPPPQRLTKREFISLLYSNSIDGKYDVTVHGKVRYKVTAKLVWGTTTPR